MNEVEKKADTLLLAILASQPELFKPSAMNGEYGRNAGDFIASLRNRLIEMYQPVK